MQKSVTYLVRLLRNVHIHIVFVSGMVFEAIAFEIQSGRRLTASECTKPTMIQRTGIQSGIVCAPWMGCVQAHRPVRR